MFLHAIHIQRYKLNYSLSAFRHFLQIICIRSWVYTDIYLELYIMLKYCAQNMHINFPKEIDRIPLSIQFEMAHLNISIDGEINIIN